MTMVKKKPAARPLSARHCNRVERLIVDLRGRCEERETWEALRKVLAALRGDWKAVGEDQDRAAHRDAFVLDSLTCAAMEIERRRTAGPRVQTFVEAEVPVSDAVFAVRCDGPGCDNPACRKGGCQGRRNG